LFADEPTANLDSTNSKEVMKVLLDLKKEGQTILLVTHEEEYANLADRVVFLKDGQIVDIKKGNR
jgi:ABC-type lipoprotein export system ATPase subunit